MSGKQEITDELSEKIGTTLKEFKDKWAEEQAKKRTIVSTLIEHKNIINEMLEIKIPTKVIVEELAKINVKVSSTTLNSTMRSVNGTAKKKPKKRVYLLKIQIKKNIIRQVTIYKNTLRVKLKMNRARFNSKVKFIILILFITFPAFAGNTTIQIFRKAKKTLQSLVYNQATTNYLLQCKV